MGAIYLRDGRRLSFAEWGDPGGFPVLEFHGPGGPGPSFVDERAIVAVGIRLITVHRPGYAQSTPAPNLSLEAFAEDVGELIEHLGLQAVGVHAVTGSAAYGLMCATRLSRVRALALSSALGPLEIAAVRAATDVRFLDLVELRHRDPSLFFERFRAMRTALKVARDANRVAGDWGGAFRGAAEQRQLADERIQTAVSRAILDHGEAFEEGVGLDFRLMREPWPFRLESIVTPTAVWHGSSDADVGVEHARHIVCGIDGAKLTIWENEGHYAYFERAPEILAWFHQY